MYLAHDPTLERDVALKLLHRHTTRSGLRDEARALAALSHPGIVTIFEIGEHEGQDFIAMEYLRGRTLRDVLAAGAPREELLGVCVKVARAVSAAHRAGILHRDIKPENVVVTDAGEVKVVDFGIARRLEHEDGRSPRAVTASEVVQTLRRTLPPDAEFAGTATDVSAGTQTMFGTPAYMAPEVLLGEVSTPESDIFSLGVVLYECLTGRRPYSATTLVEVIALTIEGPPPKLDDRFGDLVDRMLAREAGRRPSLDEIAKSLSRAATVPAARVPARSRWPIVAMLAMLAGGVAAGGWWFSRRAAPAAVPVPARTELSFAVAPFTIQIPSYGVEPPDARAIADVLAHLLGEADGARVVGTAVDVGEVAAARSVDAGHLVTGLIVEQGAVLRAEVSIVDATTGTSVTVTAERATLALVLDAVAAAVLGAVAPGTEIGLAPAPNRSRAQMFYRQGAPILESGRFTTARPYFEQAVTADPSLFEGWYALGLVLAWMEASEANVLAATEKALALAPPGPRKELVRGIGLFLAGDYRTARTTLEPLELLTGAGAPDPRELRYYLGEANWHDGRHDAGFAYFKGALERDPRFKPATVHAWQYAVARRDNEVARYYIGLAGESPEWIELALGNYEQLARSGVTHRKHEALLVLGEIHSSELEAKVQGKDIEAGTLRLAIAVAVGELGRARQEFAELWSVVLANRDPNQIAGIVYSLEGLGEVVLSAGMVDEIRLVVGFLAAQSTTHAARNYHRFAILAAPIVGDRALLEHARRSERNDKLAAASTAELDGNRAKAADLLGELVADPTFSWDYPERAALIRNLGALKRTKERSAVCADTLRPAVARPALLVIRAACR